MKIKWSKGLGKTLSTIMVGVVFGFGFVVLFVSPDKMQTYGNLLEYIFPFVASHMAAIWGGNAVRELGGKFKLTTKPENAPPPMV